jgi:hypothetical protein
MKKLIAGCFLSFVVSTGTAHAQLNSSNGVWTPVQAPTNMGHTPFDHPSWDGWDQGLNFRLSKEPGWEWLRDPATDGLARWTWKGFPYKSNIKDLGGISAFYQPTLGIDLHRMAYAGNDDVALTTTATGVIASSAPPDGSPNMSVVIAKFRIPNTYTVKYRICFEDLPDGPIGPVGTGVRDADFQDRCLEVHEDLSCDEKVAELEAENRKLKGQ